MYNLINPAQMTDGSRLGVYNDHYRKMLQGHKLESWRAAFPENYDRFQSALNGQNGGCMAIEGPEGELCGYLVFSEVVTPDYAMMEILAYRVLPAYRGHGLGGHLLDSVVQLAKSTQYLRILVMVGTGTAASRARKIYLKAGFEPTTSIMELDLAA